MKFIVSLLIVLFGTLGLTAQTLTQEQAERLVKLPLKCTEQEYPNKLGQVIGSKKDLKSPSKLHPAFYGCFDWHSAVHGHWLMVTIAKKFPACSQMEEIREQLSSHLTKENIEQEIAFFKTEGNSSFERTYGWAWILKLQMELESWNDPCATECAKNLKPLSDLLCSKYVSFLPKLVYPLRTGEHINTAFGLTFAYDYALAHQNDSLKTVIEQKCFDFYAYDSIYPLRFEPSGYDFLSPALEEADIMRRVMNPTDFQEWLKHFLPELYDPNFSLVPGKIRDRTDGKLVHLDGLNFSRAWCLNALAETSPELVHLKATAKQHIDASLPNITDGDYMGEHWLASFAMLALLSGE